MSDANTIPLFPLGTVLVPGGYLPLRIFERRYLDMIKECSGQNTCFGVVLIVPGATEEEAAGHARVGTEARIGDFYTTDDGLLGITAQGERVFEIEHTTMRDDGLLLGQVRYLPPAQPLALPVEFDILGQIVSGFMDNLEDQYPDYSPERLNDAEWISMRLVELLPLENLEKQALLETVSPLDRLQALLGVLPRFQVEDGAE